MILLIDFFDSFTFNIIETFRQLDIAIESRNFQQLEAIDFSQYEAIIFGPGYGLPQDHLPMMKPIIKTLEHKKVLGICLGHQLLALYFGASVVPLDTVNHGQQADIQIIKNTSIYHQIANPFKAGLYHSWAIDKMSLAKTPLDATAIDKQGVLMSFRHKSLNITGIQFHPESYMTPLGKTILKNWATG